MALKKHHIGIGAVAVAVALAAGFAAVPTKAESGSVEQRQAGVIAPAQATAAPQQSWSDEWAGAHRRVKYSDQAAAPSF